MGGGGCGGCSLGNCVESGCVVRSERRATHTDVICHVSHEVNGSQDLS